jgi:hypothetical protein
LCLVASFIFTARALSSTGERQHRQHKFADQPIAWLDGGTR